MATYLLHLLFVEVRRPEDFKSFSLLVIHTLEDLIDPLLITELLKLIALSKALMITLQLTLIKITISL